MPDLNAANPSSIRFSFADVKQHAKDSYSGCPVGKEEENGRLSIFQIIVMVCHCVRNCLRISDCRSEHQDLLPGGYVFSQTDRTIA